MPAEKIRHLMSGLHDRFGDSRISPQQEGLMQSLAAYVHDLNEAEPANIELIDMVERVITEVEAEHPAASKVLSEILKVLRDIGV